MRGVFHHQDRVDGVVVGFSIQRKLQYLLQSFVLSPMR